MSDETIDSADEMPVKIQKNSPEWLELRTDDRPRWVELRVKFKPARLLEKMLASGDDGKKEHLDHVLSEVARNLENDLVWFSLMNYGDVTFGVDVRYIEGTL